MGSNLLQFHNIYGDMVLSFRAARRHWSATSVRKEAACPVRTPLPRKLQESNRDYVHQTSQNGIGRSHRDSVRSHRVRLLLSEFSFQGKENGNRQTRQLTVH
jgi:hypothetical protein